VQTAIYILIAGIAALILWWLVRLIWFRPFSINHFYLRVFIPVLFENPEMMTMLGIFERFGINFHNDDLADASETYASKVFRRLHRDLKTLRSYDRQRQSKAQLLSTDILDYFMDDQARSESFRYHGYPLNQMFGLQSEMPNFMLTMHPVNGRTNSRNYVRRLSKFGKKFDQVLESLHIREAKGCIPPRFVIRRVLDEMIAFTGHAARQNPLYTVFAEKLAKLNLSDVERQKVLAAAEQEIEKTVYPAYQKLIAYFTELEQKATSDDGVWKLPDGDAYYAYCLRGSTTTDLTPQQVHEIGLAEVARIEGEMQTILKDLGYPDANVAEQMLAFAKEERFLYSNTDEGKSACLEDYQQILDHIDQNLSQVFDLRPKAGLKVERVPEFREKTSAGAYYQPGSMGGARPGVFYANLRDMQEVPKFGMQTLAYHEGIPGHHFQISIALELKGLPVFRQLIPFTAYVEGWALYAEKLAGELGFFDDPFSKLGYLSSELFRAVRLVVDTSIHFKHWTREQAIEYMESHTGMAHESVISEIERYIVMPGQACAYKIGEINIVELRNKAKKALGERFDLRQFHNIILKGGAMPLSILEQVVDEYIKEAAK
jgi:uncharacterized protein (DUF885 family)